MHEEIEKLGEKVNAIREKSENATFIEAALEKYRKEAEEKEELLHIKTDEFYRSRQGLIYNKEKYLPLALRSVQNQSLRASLS